jgi:hypothetical protein
MMSDMEADSVPDQPVTTGSPEPRPESRPEPAPDHVLGLQVQSREDTDVGWGEPPESSDDRLYRDRPPHWGSA